MVKKNDYESLWEEALLSIKSEVGETSFARWFSLKFSGDNDKGITLKVPSRFHADQVTKRYPTLIEKKLREFFGTDMAVRFEVDENPADSENTAPKAALTAKPAEQNAQKERAIPFNELYTFDNYIIGDNNEFAVSASMAVSRNPGTAGDYNPLFIYGGVGLGKTHLLQAIGNYIHTTTSNKIVYTTASDFITEFTEAVKDRDTKAFKRKYRKADLLLIDDIHVLENKERTLEELFDIFGALYDAKKQMVFTCDRPVTALKQIPERLKSRLGSGLQVDIQMPKYETRFAILLKKMEEYKLEINNDEKEKIIGLICKNISSNVRDMVGALNRLIGFTRLTNKKLTLEVAQEQLKDIFTSPKQSNISVDMIIQVIAFHFGIPVAEIKGKSRKANVVYPRQLAMYIARTNTEFSTTEIGQIFGGRDHSTVIYAVEKIETRKNENAQEEDRIQQIINKIRAEIVK